MQVGIVGGSIAGCTAAHLLKKAGHDVTVFERSNKALVGRGGGIGTSPALLAEIREQGLIGQDFVSFHADRLPLVGKHPDHEPSGRQAWQVPISLDVFQWNELWYRLRKNIPDGVYHGGVSIAHAEHGPDRRVTLTTDRGDQHAFDLVLFADGYQSLGRRILFPEKQLKDRGYVLWRGLLPEYDLGRSTDLGRDVLRISYPDAPGHLVVYFIPGQDGSVRNGERVFNWAAYLAFPDADLHGIMTDRTGNLRVGTLPPGNMQPAVEARLKAWLAPRVPEVYGEIVRRTSDSYIQVIYTMDLDRYARDRMALIGDAGMVIQPFTASGVFKGYHNVRDLLDALQRENDLDAALESWSDAQVRSGRRVLALGAQMEQAFIWKQPDFSTLSARDAEAWWTASFSAPKEFDYREKE